MVSPLDSVFAQRLKGRNVRRPIQVKEKRKERRGKESISIFIIVFIHKRPLRAVTTKDKFSSKKKNEIALSQKPKKNEKLPEQREKNSLEYPARNTTAMTRSQKKTQNLRQPQDEQGKKGNQKMPGTGKIYMEVEKKKGFPSSERKEEKSDQPLSASLSRETKKPGPLRNVRPASMPVGWVYVETKGRVNIP